jgi:uncharacterized protein (DUF1499 family)
MAKSRPGGRRPHPAKRISTAALVLAIVAGLFLASAGLGYRLGWWGLGPAFTILAISVYVAAAILVIAVVGSVWALIARSWTGFAAAVLALLIAAGTAAIPLDMRRAGAAVPRIHDITTDSEHPPEFVALRPERDGAPNGAAYGGEEVAAQQRAGYPDIGPVLLSVPPARAFAQVEAVARSLGWHIVAAVPAEGRLEATDTTRWFGFKDDIVVRVAPALDGSRVDVRSVSRVGRSDLGVNAKRIRAFLAALRR